MSWLPTPSPAEPPVVLDVPATSPPPSRRRRRVLAVLLAVALLVGLGVVVAARVIGRDPDDCDRRARDSAARAAADAGPSDAPGVVVIGDSYSVGAGLADRSLSWPARLAALPARVHVAGYSGSGFEPGALDCTDVSYPDRAPGAVAGRPDAVVVVQGGLNDWDQPETEVAAGLRRTAQALQGHRVVLVGPPHVDVPEIDAEVPRLDALLRRLAGEVGWRYLPMTAVDLDFVDRLHPDVAGHTRFGDRVARGIADLVGAAP
ncbi:SGNH/GDSL hydrolase family protein [Nocardioides sp.]|uniref:SGNH/GDSL hydrolase family protein n=1 Tax=Nocardioides sp. TaxID=35761 RepID=UPI003517F0A6